MRKVMMAVAIVAAAACGSSQKHTTTVSGDGNGGDDSVTHSPDGSGGVTGEALDDVSRAFKSKHGTINNCYSDAVNGGKLSRHVGGRLTISTTIHTDGTVADVKVTDDELKSPDVEACVIKTVSGWTVPGPNVQFPFSFSYSFRGE
jgi:hypothetical protein